MSPEDFAPTPNALLGGRYRLTRRLGAGGMATVWAAQDETLQREVAVKVLSDALTTDDTFRARFEREARIAASLSHPALVPVHDFGSESGWPYLVMEVVDGTTLADLIGGNPFPRLDRRALAQDLLAALGHIHTAGIVHRDIKPANVLVEPSGRVRLTDFGIAQATDSSSLTQTGAVIGTLAYMAPELQRGEPATPRSDLYALGVLLRNCGSLDRELADLVQHLTAPEPERRPPSASEALSLLEVTRPTQVLGSEARTVPMREAPVGGEGRRGVMPWLLVLSAVLAAVLIAALVLSADDEGGTQTPASNEGAIDRPDESPKSADDPATEAPTPAGVQEVDSADESEATESAETEVADCAAIEAEKQALEEKKSAAEAAAGDDPAAKEAILAQYEEDKAALEEQAEACKG